MFIQGVKKMEHIDVENKIKSIRDSLTEELKRLKAIEESLYTTYEDAFNRIMDEKIKEMDALEPLVADEYGVVKDRYAANIFFHQIELMNEMRKNKNINIDTNAESLNRGLQNETEMFAQKPKKQIFKNGIKKLLQKFSVRKREIENER